ncbi:MAG: ABC transporter ATP-binding protein [Actinomycetota bacterium]|nr:ABC transporter ATP-binding protein [Actinomycetota bacterium]
MSTPSLAPQFGTPALKVRDLCISFGGVQAVNHCTFVVPETTAVGLIGPNGAGKSTTIDLISGFKAADSGHVDFRGQELIGMKPHEISKLGIVRTFQSPREWPSLSVLDNVLIGTRGFDRESLLGGMFATGRQRRAEKESLQHARDLLEDFGLTPLKNDAAGSLSGGQKRLVEFARIAAASPSLVILDEPMGGVNPVLGERIGKAVRALIEQGSSVIVVEHNLRFIEDYCDLVVVMDQGAVIAEGPYESLRDNPQVVTAYLGDVENA